MSVPVNGDSGPWRTTGPYGLPPLYTYEQLERYYAGRQPLAFLAPEVAAATAGRLTSLVVNWPRLVVDSLEERLDVEGFRLGPDLGADDKLWTIWQANGLDVGSQLCHLEALLHGISYVLVWADPIAAEVDPEAPRVPQITVESSALMTVEWDQTGVEILSATKRWVSGGQSYANIFYLDRVEKYIGRADTAISADVPVNADTYTLRQAPITHDLGQVPVVPFVNRPSLSNPFGESEIADIIPLANAVNKLSTDMMVSAEYHAMPRRWATGVETGGSGDVEKAREAMLNLWTRAAPGRFTSSDNDAARFGQFSEASLANFVSGVEMLTSQVAALAGLPPQHLGLNPQGNPASADALRSAETTLVKRVERKQRVFGESWEDVMRLACIVRDGTPLANAELMETIWRDPNTPTIAQKVDAAAKLNDIGLPLRQNLEDLGYTPTQIDRITAMTSSDSIARYDAQLVEADRIVVQHGMSRAAALAIVGLDKAAEFEAKVEARQPALAAELEGPEIGEGQAAVAAPTAVPPVVTKATPPAPPAK